MKQPYIRFVILIIILALLIGFILLKSDHLMQELDQRMPEIGSSNVFSPNVLPANNSKSSV